MSLEVQTIKMSGKASLNLSLEIDRRSILEVLENEGFVIIQGATDINSSERAKFNKVSSPKLTVSNYLLTVSSILQQSSSQPETAILSLVDLDTGHTLR